MIKTFCRLFVIATAAFAGLGIGPTRPPKIPHVAILVEESAGPVRSQLNGLRDGLEELKYLDGKNLKLSVVQEEQPETLKARLKDTLQRATIDAIVALGTRETAIAKELSATIPILFLPATDPVQSGFVRSLASPEKNLTGLSFLTGSENVGKQLEMFKLVAPALRQVVVLIDDRQDTGINNAFRKQIAAVAPLLGIQLIEQTLMRTPEPIRQLVPDLKHVGLFPVCSGFFRQPKPIAAMAAKRRLPLFGCSASQVADGKALMTYAPDLYAMGYRGASFIDRILKGVAPQALPVETPRKFDLVINRKIAQEIGLKIPAKVLNVTDRVFD